MTIRTPSNLELLLHCYVSPNPHPRYEAQAIQEGIQYLEDNDMIVDTGHKVYSVTKKGEAYIGHLLKVPFPVETTVWKVPK